jgi:hypothetical protein
MTFTLTHTSRKVARKALGLLLKTALEGASGLAQKVYDHAPADFTTSPVVCVRSGPALRKRWGIGQTKSNTKFKLEVLIYVLAGGKAAGWKPENAQDAFDDIEAAVSQIVITNPTNAAWASLTLAEQETEVLHLPAPDTGGFPYDVEIITAEVQAYD